MTTMLIGIDGLQKMMRAHPDFLELQVTPGEAAVTATIRRRTAAGERMYSVTFTAAEIPTTRPQVSYIWDIYPERMMAATARRRCIYKAFPEFNQRGKDPCPFQVKASNN
jgi:hypothetical protein